SSDTIVETLVSVQLQDSLECVTGVYLADDDSTDSTIELARASWVSETPLEVFVAIRNRGERQNVNEIFCQLAATHDWLVVLHADDVAKRGWLAQLTETMSSSAERVASVCSSWDELLPDGSVQLGEEDPHRPVQVIEG